MIELNSFYILDQQGYNTDISQYSGLDPHQRDLVDYIEHGFIVLDKPAGPTSHDVVSTVKKILGIEKAGHLGTLDPNVSGVLPIGLGNTTKILSILSGSKKRYICNLKLHQNVKEKTLRKILNEFTGEIYQFPPLKSNVAMKLRKRRIYEIKLLEHNNNEYLLDIHCEAGTYIRVLCIDIGKVLGVGGEMKELRRLSSANFSENNTFTLHDLFDAISDARDGITEEPIRQIVKPLEEVVKHIPAIIIRNNSIDSVSNGATLSLPGILAYQDFIEDTEIRILSVTGELIALAKSLVNSDFLKTTNNGQIAQPFRVIFTKDRKSKN